MFNYRDEYEVATEKARINQHNRRAVEGYKFGVLNLFLLTTIGVMGYVGLDSLKNISTEKSVEYIKSDSNLLEILSNIDIEESKNNLESLNIKLNKILDDKSLSRDSKYTKALSSELEEYKKRNSTY